MSTQAYARLDLGDLAAVPTELTRLDSWVCWKEVAKPNGAKPAKVPVNARTLRNASVTEPDDLSPFDTAVGVYMKNPTLAGVGFVFTEADEYLGIDCDKCRDKDTGELAAWAQSLANKLNSYSEVSPSGTGIKIIVKGQLPEGGTHFQFHGREFEAYECGRYFTITGRAISEAPLEIFNRQDVLDGMTPAREQCYARDHVPAIPRASDPLAPLVDALSDDELLRRIRNSKQAEKFESFMAGDVTGLGRFAASGGLTAILAFWTRSEARRIDRLYRTSKLYEQEWWDDICYRGKRARGEVVIENAIALVGGKLYVPHLSPDAPMDTARAFLAETYVIGGVPTLRHTGGVFYAWHPEHGSAYVEHSPEQMQEELYKFLERQTYIVPKTERKDAHEVRFNPTQRKVSNTLDALRAVAQPPEKFRPPCWLAGGDGFDPLNILPCANGLLHIPTRELLPATPLFFSHNGCNFAYDKDAPQPQVWLKTLGELWKEDEDSVKLLQELFAYFLTPYTHLQKIAFLIGPRRGGKGTVCRVLHNLVGESNCCAPTLNSLAENFGLQALIAKSLAIISDARIDWRSDSSQIVERLLSVSGEDAVSVSRKFLPDWNGTLGTRFLVTTNLLPYLPDTSGALASRIVMLKLTKTFLGKEDTKLTSKLLAELPGILNWTLDGWDRLHANKKFTMPASAAAEIMRMEELSNPVGSFLDSNCEVKQGSKFQTSVDDLYQSWVLWCGENGQNPGSSAILGRNLHAHLPWLETVQATNGNGKRVRMWAGIRILSRAGSDAK